MCGIVGIVNKEQGLYDTAETVRKMSETLNHRGPDDQGY